MAEDLNVSMEFIKVFDDINKTEPKLKPIKRDYNVCKEKIEKFFIHTNGVLGMIVDKDYAISFEKPSSYKVYNPFYNIYVLDYKNSIETGLRLDDLNLTDNSSVGAISQDKLEFGNFLHSVRGEVGMVDFDMPKNSFVVKPCCDVVGVSINKREFLTNSYLKKLVKREEPYDGYIGASFYEKGSKIYVYNVDFNLKNIKFCPHDEIVSINGIKIKSKSQLRRMVLSASKGETLVVFLKRAGVYKEVKIEVQSSPKYSINTSSYLSKLGVRLSSNLVVTDVYKNSFASKNGLLKGDKLLEVNFKSIKTPAQLKNKMLYTKKKEFHLLFTRKDFQFFVNFDRKDIKGGLVAIGFCPAI